MYNLLSYQPGTMFTGAEIKDWARHTLLSKDPVKKNIAKWVLRHYTNLKDSKQYAFYLQYRSDDSSQPKVPIFYKYTAVV